MRSSPCLEQVPTRPSTRDREGHRSVGAVRSVARPAGPAGRPGAPCLRSRRALAVRRCGGCGAGGGGRRWRSRAAGRGCAPRRSPPSRQTRRGVGAVGLAGIAGAGRPRHLGGVLLPSPWPQGRQRRTPLALSHPRPRACPAGGAGRWWRTGVAPAQRGVRQGARAGPPSGSGCSCGTGGRWARGTPGARPSTRRAASVVDAGPR
jgi:hypothetical protein